MDVSESQDLKWRTTKQPMDDIPKWFTKYITASSGHDDVTSLLGQFSKKNMCGVFPVNWEKENGHPEK